ncbi:hypothetical protein M378DRAFT_12212 [Amanita muscaria Koide BX008]|uniref:Uncharacterized protein n=1 Tax=Amanita muscaria (strain Koide BX008) TaxID=946122 RepID=A0A0C2X3L0_AMAMK|nr:hypothetical protein M378DRAFT_12212 [Amanita muscaria Koide BX008]
MTDSPHIDSPSLQQVRETRTSPSNSLPSPVAQSSNAQLASLLAAALNDVETLRRELVATKKRAEDAERRCHAFSSVSDPKSTQADTARIIQDFDQRALEAEAARDDSDSRRRALIDTWHQLDRYLQMVEVRAADARAGFQKIVTDGGGGQLVLNSIPTFYSTVGSMAPPPNHSRALYSSSGRSHGHRSSQSQSGFPPLPLPPHPTPNGNGRRPRDESLDRSGYSDTVPGQPPHKKLKSYGGDDRRGRDERTAYSENNLAYMHRRHQPLPPQTIDSRDRIYVERRVPQPRMIVPPGGEATDYANHRGRSHSRSSSRSSRSSLSLDEMLLLATGEGANGAGGPAEAVSQQRASHRRRHHPREDHTNHRYPPSNEPSIQLQHHSQSQQQQRTPDDSSPTQTQPFVPQNYRTRAPHTSASVQPVAENHVNAGVPAAHHVQTIQTHVFAPVVTGAPIKKVKGGSVSNLTTSGTGPGEAPPATPQHIYPPTNAQGQRICRQCGMAGRYKEGKCVEKWGPGPMGPGTVCDRCRKKMKRVERRGNLEAANSLNNVNALQQPQQTQPIPPRNVLQQTQSGTIHRTDTLINTTTQQQQQSYSHSDRARDRDRDRDNRDRDESDARTALVAAVSGSGTGGGSNHHHSNTSSHRATTSAAVAALPSATHSTTRQSHLPSPPPAIASINDELPTSNVGRGVTTRGQHSQHSRPQSRNSRNERSAPAPAPVASTVAGAPVTTAVPSVLTTSKCSPLASARDGSRGASEGDPDADADADADAEAEGEVETEIEGAAESGDQDGTSQVEGEISLEGGLDEEDDEILAAAGV